MGKAFAMFIGTVALPSVVLASIAILPESQCFDWQGGDAAITTSGTGGWKAHKDCSWITISPRTSGSCGESCIYTISANNTVTNRTGKITIDYLPQHPTNDVAWGLTWWQGQSFNSTNRWNDTNMVNDVLATGTSYRDVGLPGEPTVSTYWGRTESVWFKVTELNLLNRLFDLDNGAGSIYVNTENKITIQYGDEVMVTDYTVSQNFTYELLVISGASDGDSFTPGTSTHLNEIYIGGINGGISYTNIYSQRSHHMMLVSDYGHTTLPSANYITSGETSQGAYSYWNRVLSAEEIQNHSNLGMVSPDVASHELYQNLFCYFSGENRVVTFSRGYKNCGIMPQLYNPTPHYTSNGGTYYTYYEGRSYRDRNGLTAGAISGDIEPYSVPCTGLCAWGLGDNNHDNYCEMEFIPYDDLHFDPQWASYRSRANYGSAFKCLNSSADSSTIKTNVTINLWCKDISDDNIYTTSVKTNKFFEIARAASTMWSYSTMGEYSDKRAYWDKPSTSGSYRPIAAESEFGIWIIDNGRERCKSFVVKEKDDWYGPFEIPIQLNDEWGMVTISYANGLLTIYVNGIDVGNCPMNPDWKYLVPSLWCAYGRSWQYGPGNMWYDEKDRFAFDEVEVFSNKLSSQEIRNLYALEYQQPLVHTITQSGREATLSATSCKVSSEASSVRVNVTLPFSGVHWSVKNLPAWLSVNNATNNHYGTKTITLSASENNSVYARTATILIAEQAFTFEQDGVAVELDCSAVGVDQAGGRRSIAVRPERSVTWTAVSDVPWITIMSGSSGTGNGNVSFYVDSYSANSTRTGTLTIAGLPVTILQRGFSDLSLTPSSIEVEGVATNMTIRVSKTSGANIAAVSYAPWISLGTVSVGQNICTVNCSVEENPGKAARVGYVNISGIIFTVSQEQRRIVSSIEYTNLKGGCHDNPTQYAEGEAVALTPAYGVMGYTFAGWTPSQITTEMTGNQTVSASWTANSYSIAYNSNGGSGTMDATAATYDAEATVATNRFTWTGYIFTGWATNELGEVIYAAGQPVTNLTEQAGGTVTLYAVWEPLMVSSPEVSIDGGEAISASTSFAGDSCTVTIQCATEGATIYYGINTVPRERPSNIYAGAFTITETSTIYAFAKKDGVASGSPISVIITKQTLTVAEAASAGAAEAALSWTTGGGANWMPINDTTAVTGQSAQSGSIGDSTNYGEWNESWLETTVVGSGNLAFRWKVDCEDDGIDSDTWDHVSFFIDGAEVARMDGHDGWRDFLYTIPTEGTHTLRWSFLKDDYNEEVFADHAWVSGFTWSPINGETDDPIPEVASDGEIVAALAGTTDASLTANITNVAQYAAYRSWALSVTNATTTAQTIKDSTRTWLSYALGADALIGKEITSNDVRIVAFEVMDTDSGVMGSSRHTFAFEVAIDNVNIGGVPVAEAVLKENLKKVLEVEGAATLSPGAFSPDNIEITFDAPVDGKARFTVSPPADAGNSFFMRVKVK